MPHAPEWLSRPDVLTRFRQRASPDEVRRFNQFVKKEDPVNQTHALELVLFRLTSDELFKIGVPQAGGTATTDLVWMVAESDDSIETRKAMDAALAKAGVGAFASMDLGFAGWYVSPDEYFISRDALFKSGEALARGIKPLSPKLTGSR